MFDSDGLAGAPLQSSIDGAKGTTTEAVAKLLKDVSKVLAQKMCPGCISCRVISLKQSSKVKFKVP